MIKTTSKNISILGGGSWSTAIAHVCAQAGHQVILWARDDDTIQSINQNHMNHRYLSDICVDPAIIATSNLGESINKGDIVILGTPAQTTRELCQKIQPYMSGNKQIIILAKGIEQTSGYLLSQVVEEFFPSHSIYALSGPSFAHDVVRGLPTAVTIAGQDLDACFKICQTIATPSFRPYASNDIIGVQIGGAFKNVLAIACGIVTGKGLGASASAAVASRGFAEIQRLGKKMGADSQTLMGLSGLGDLMLCCASTQSRNFAFGVALGKGQSISALTKQGQKLAEGAFTAPVAIAIGSRYNCELPIISKIADLIKEKITVDDAVTELMQRPLKQEV